MLAVAFPRRTWAVVGALAVVIALSGAFPGMVGNGRASTAGETLAARLMRLDPRARLGGHTQGGPAPGARLRGVRDWVNFFVGPAPGQRIMAGAGHDQLGAYGTGGAR